MTPDFEIKQYDTARSITYTLNVGTTPIDLTNATISLNILTPNNEVLHRSCSIVEATSGSVLYNFEPEDSATAGLHKLEYKVQFLDGTVIRIPSDSWIYMQVNSAIGS